MAKSASFIRSIRHQKRLWVYLCILSIIVSVFWFTSRYPALIHEGERAHEGTLTQRSLGRITKDELMNTSDSRGQSRDSVVAIIAKTSVNWFYTNRVGMSFGILFGGIFLALFSSFSLRKSIFCMRGWKGALFGLLSGVPLGVCANCVAPMGLSFRKKGMSLESMLASMVSSPTLNIVALYIAFSVFTFDFALIKLFSAFFLILILIPVISSLFPSDIGTDETSQTNKDSSVNESWGHAIVWGIFTFLKETVRLSILTLPLMILTGIVGGVMSSYIPLETFIKPEMNQFVLVILASIFGTLLPIPMLVDVILVLSLVESGLSRGPAIALLITLPSYSIFSASILWRYVSRKLAVYTFVAVCLTGVAGGVFVMGLDYFMLRIQPRNFENILGNTILKNYGPGSGASWSDYDGDGRLDLLMVGGRKDSYLKLYKNTGGDTFKDVTEESGLVVSQVINSGIWGDYDNDGCPDLYLSSQSNSNERVGNSDLLFHNTCKGTFIDVTKNAGMHNAFHATGAAWGDYDNDGFLDLYAANYGADISYKTQVIEPNILYRNNRNGTFTNVIDSVGVSGNAVCPKKVLQNSGAPGFTYIGGERPKQSYQPIWFDYNNDGKIDLFIATDSGVSPLYKNNGDGTFSDVTEEAGLCRVATGMGVAVGDYNGDGNTDLFVTNTGEYHLWKNNGNGTFSEVARKLGISRNLLGWGAGFIDFDNDGDTDIYAVNGIISDTTVRRKFEYYNDILFQNNGNGTFSDITYRSGIYGNEPKLGAAFGDFNGDGFTDIVVVTDIMREKKSEQKNRLYKNKGNNNHWIQIKLVGTVSNRDGYGAKVLVTTDRMTTVQQSISSSSFYSQNSPWLNFGLNTSEKVNKIEVHWPSGIIQKIQDVPAGQILTIIEKK